VSTTIDEDEAGTDLALVEPEDEESEGEVVLGSIIKSDNISDILGELAEIEGPIKPPKTMTKAKALQLNTQIADACHNYGVTFDDWVQAGEHVITLIEEGLQYKAFAALKLDPVDWIKSVVDFPMVDPKARKVLTKMLWQLGLSVRGIAEVTGSSKSTASRDLNDVSQVGHVTKGRDGKDYVASEDEEPQEDWEEVDNPGELVEDEGEYEEQQPRQPLPARMQQAVLTVSAACDTLHAVSEDNGFTKSHKTFAKKFLEDLLNAYAALQEVLDVLDPTWHEASA